MNNHVGSVASFFYNAESISMIAEALLTMSWSSHAMGICVGVQKQRVKKSSEVEISALCRMIGDDPKVHLRMTQRHASAHAKSG